MAIKRLSKVENAHIRHWNRITRIFTCAQIVATAAMGALAISDNSPKVTISICVVFILYMATATTLVTDFVTTVVEKYYRGSNNDQ